MEISVMNPPQVHLPNFWAAVSMGISHSLFGSRWITNLHPISYHTSKPSSQKTQPKPISVPFLVHLPVMLKQQHWVGCTPSAVSVHYSCGWMRRFCLTKAGKFVYGDCILGTYSAQGSRRKKTSSLSVDFLGWWEPLSSYYKHAKRISILCCVSAHRVLFHD